MERFSPAMFVKHSSVLEAIAKGRDKDAPNDDEIISERLRKIGSQVIRRFRKNCVFLGLRASAITAGRLLSLYSQKGSTYGQEKELVSELNGRVVDEMKGDLYFFLTPSEAELYNDWENGWEDILERFPSIIRDVEEMNKCFAFSRYTASIFHALHVAEWGAIALGDFIGVIDPRKGWGPTERKLRELIKGGHANLPASLDGKFEFLEQMNREIDSMVLAWRHKVDHAANHLAIIFNSEFTPEIAEHVIGAVRIFMQRLIEGIPHKEVGLPT
jgi:hypothetical protein